MLYKLAASEHQIRAPNSRAQIAHPIDSSMAWIKLIQTYALINTTNLSILSKFGIFLFKNRYLHL